MNISKVRFHALKLVLLAATDDVVYGQAGARALADSDPNLAITNADSHEYFAEDTPPLP
jgi:peptidyl-Lys metalloendopeptidase